MTCDITQTWRKKGVFSPFSHIPASQWELMCSNPGITDLLGCFVLFAATYWWGSRRDTPSKFIPEDLFLTCLDPYSTYESDHESNYKILLKLSWTDEMRDGQRENIGRLSNGPPTMNGKWKCSKGHRVPPSNSKVIVPKQRKGTNLLGWWMLQKPEDSQWLDWNWQTQVHILPPTVFYRK